LLNSKARPLFVAAAVFDILGVFSTALAMYFLLGRKVFQPTFTLQFVAMVCYAIGVVCALVGRRRMNQ
jgi:predicted membrane-bound dolichyl-phosphate-mannose-protein mannosyltransferase